MKVTPYQIRAEQRELAFTAEECAVIADALEIADSCARADIESYCPSKRGAVPGERWYDTDDGTVDDEAISQCIRYLEARGLLMRDPNDPRIVSFRAAPQPEVTT